MSCNVRRMLKIEDSDVIKAVGFDPNTKILMIEFANGNLYAYPSVADETYVQFLNAESLGAFFHKTIKPRINGTQVNKAEQISKTDVIKKVKDKQLPPREQLPLMDVLEPTSTKRKR